MAEQETKPTAKSFNVVNEGRRTVFLESGPVKPKEKGKATLNEVSIYNSLKIQK